MSTAALCVVAEIGNICYLIFGGVRNQATFTWGPLPQGL